MSNEITAAINALVEQQRIANLIAYEIRSENVTKQIVEGLGL